MARFWRFVKSCFQSLFYLLVDPDRLYPKVLLCLLALPASTMAQKIYATRSDVKAAIDEGHQATATGWVIRKGDTLTLGRGTLPGGGYTYIYQSQNAQALLTGYGPNYRTPTKEYLRNTAAGQILIVKRLDAMGTKATGWSMYAVVNAGLVYNYWVELDNAIAAGEVVPPAKYRTATATATATATMSVADELTKLKKLKDDGILSEEEFQAQKKKLLGQ